MHNGLHTTIIRLTSFTGGLISPISLGGQTNDPGLGWDQGDPGQGGDHGDPGLGGHHGGPDLGGDHDDPGLDSDHGDSGLDSGHGEPGSLSGDEGEPGSRGGVAGDTGSLVGETTGKLAGGKGGLIEHTSLVGVIPPFYLPAADDQLGCGPHVTYRSHMTCNRVPWIIHDTITNPWR